MGLWKSYYLGRCSFTWGCVMGICSFLPKEFKDRLVELASVDDLVAAGYSRRAAYNVKHHKIISDERCDRLVQVLGDRAKPILVEALQAFEKELSALGVRPASSCPDINTLSGLIEAVIGRYFEAYFGRPKPRDRY